ncbi:RNA recognition motif-containing protein [Thermosporothrix hazakensis]|jgi:RNA recognition motif-containing protein|uniref:RNA recognition motif-containing protein n=2 Tax=Thermosporothrix TaxID=768650 RepID=A0A326UN05_THEHA|nr:RNA-binding protein [Thermosporothrix hazakensis]PZW34513.1 RNA recognition motif-containing protein [Thermosporothrix hazakensis]BBH85636.1 RNA-binding protein [Thermosporothrix sp. COM3]GCE45935.1 RNA-binding protein [Thermosporothrix hazakensis]
MKIYVGNLSYQTDSQNLSSLFERMGQVDSAQVVTDRDTGRSRGFGFVEMANDQEAYEAIQNLNGTEFEGRRITVSEARSRNTQGGYGERRYNNGPRRERRY